MLKQIIFYLILFHSIEKTRYCRGDGLTVPVHVGVVLDMGTLVGKMGMTSISLAIDEFYSLNKNYTTRVVLHARDSNADVVQAASSALDLIENKKVQAIIGPQQSAQAIFLSQIANKYQVPLLSFISTSPSLSSINTPYFIRTSIDDFHLVNGPLISIIKSFGWRRVIPIYENTEYGRGILPSLTDTLQGISTKISYRSVINPSLSDDQLERELYKLMTMDTRVFIVHMTAPIGSRLFSKAKELGMMSKGYVWIITSGLTNIVDSLHPSVIESMQGLLGIKLYLPRSKKLDDFRIQWKRKFTQKYPNDQIAEPSIFELWAYDTAYMLAISAEESVTNDSSITGPKLLNTILNLEYSGLSGHFHLIDKHLISFSFEIINVIGRGGRQIGFWTNKHGISKTMNQTTMNNGLKPIIWPGESNEVPKGWINPSSGKKLRIGVPIKNEFQEFVKVERNPVTNETIVRGYSIDVFEAVVQNLPYAISYEYVPFEDTVGHAAGTYNDLLYQVYLQELDGVVGDITILANRSKYVDFTLPYSDTGVAMLVPVTRDARKNAWIFLQPLTANLWLGSFAFLCFTGFTVWFLEHRISADFRGPISQQFGTMLYFAFSMLVFAHRETVHNILSRIVIIVWVFVMLILTTSYTASLSSLLTVQDLKPTITNVHQLQQNSERIGYHKGSFVEAVLKQHNFDDSRLKAYENPDEYEEALAKGSKNGGVAAIFHSIAYIKVFLSKYCTGYTMVGPIYKTAGIGFAFPKGSPLVADISKSILNVTEGEVMVNIENKWFGDQNACLNRGSILKPQNFNFGSFRGLFLITGIATACALFISITLFFYKNWHELKNAASSSNSIRKTLSAWFAIYNRKDLTSRTFRRAMLST